MTAIITDNYRVDNARNFKSSITSENNLYFFIGRAQPWPIDSAPPIPKSTTKEYGEIFNNLLSLKKLTTTDLISIVPRRDWVSGEVYVARDCDDENLSTKRFYCYNPDTNGIYVCLYVPKNISGVSQPSTIQPNDASSFGIPKETADGYVWVLVTKTSSGSVSNFLTEDWLPVETNTSISWTQDNTHQILSAKLTAGLTNVVTNINGYIGLLNATPTTSSIVLRRNSGSGDLFSDSVVNVDASLNSGSVYIISGPGAGQVRTISSFDSTTKTIVLTSAFSPQPDTTSLIVIGPTITVTGNGTGAKLYPHLLISGGTGNLIGVKTLVAGSGYTVADAYIVGAGYNNTSAAIITPQISPKFGYGYDAETELFARYLMIKAKLNYADNADIITLNDYRQCGIIRGVQNHPASNAIVGGVASDTTLSALRYLTSESNPSLVPDQIITQGSGESMVQAKVAEILLVDEEYVIKYYQDLETGYGTFITGDITGGAGSIAIVVPASDLEINPGYGEILYVENFRAISRNPDQMEDIRCIITF